jgi:hypothetical protein
MAGFVYESGSPTYEGCMSVYQFVNDDGDDPNRCCGQAAIATFLAILRVLPTDISTLKAIESVYPPNVLFGWLGTSRGLVARACEINDVFVSEIGGEEALKEALTAKQPVVLLIGTSAGKLWGCELPGGHWTVAYGYDDAYIYLTNWGLMPWDEFRQRWRSWVSAVGGMSGRGLIART